MTLAEAVATALTSWLALVITLAYGMDATGARNSPFVVAALATGLVCILGGGVARTVTFHAARFFTWAAIVGLMLGWLLWLAWPSLLPPGRGPDLTHHLLLVDFIERNGQLPHDLSLEASMGEMAHYTPGLHLLSVFAGAWTGTDGFRSIYSVVALCAAMTAGFVFLIALRLLPTTTPRISVALSSVLLAIGVRAYVADAFVHDAFLPQVVSALFAVALWWAVTLWDETGSKSAPGIVALMGTAVFLTWPVWLGPPLIALIVIVLTRRTMTWPARLSMLVATLTPLAIVAVAHSIGRARWLLLVRASGAALQPSLEIVGILLPALAAIGFILAFTERRARATLVLLAAIAVQAVVLYAMATSIGSETPYMAFKMSYLAVYPLAVLAALALGRFGDLLGSAGRLREGVLSAICAAIAVATIRPMLAAPKAVPVVFRDFYDAGQWARANVGTTCVDYLVEDPQTAYWLHLAVLGNPRASERTAAVDRDTMRDALARWIPADGLPYAIADLTRLPDEIRARVEIVKQFGRAAVIKRPGAAACEAE